MAEAAMLERHIMQAQARAMSADEKELNRVSSGLPHFPDLGLPPGETGTLFSPLCNACVQLQEHKTHFIQTQCFFCSAVALSLVRRFAVAAAAQPHHPGRLRDRAASGRPGSTR